MSYFARLLSQQAHTLRLPQQSEDDVQRHVRMHQSASPERAPFRRQLDFWAFSIATTLAQGLEPLEGPSSSWGRKFIDTRQVQISDGLCDLLAVVAFHHLGSDHEDIDNPAQIIESGNRFAGAGTPIVLNELTNPDFRSTALQKILEFAASLHDNAVAPSRP